MQTKIIIFLASLLANLTAGAPDYFHFDLDYYPRPDLHCASVEKKITLDLQETHNCYNLGHQGAKSFSTSADPAGQIPDGCQIGGYDRPGCQGNRNLLILGPTLAGTCYTVKQAGKSQSLVAAKSVVMVCRPKAEPSYAASPIPPS